MGYVRDALAGAKTLGRLIASSLDLGHGPVHALNAVSIVTQRRSSIESELERDQLQFMAEHARPVAVEILDGEGFALWKPA